MVSTPNTTERKRRVALAIRAKRNREAGRPHTAYCEACSGFQTFALVKKQRKGGVYREYACVNCRRIP